MSPVNSMFVCIKKKKKIIGKSVFKMADIGKMLNIGADNRSTPSGNVLCSFLEFSCSYLSEEWGPPPLSVCQAQTEKTQMPQSQQDRH